MEQAEAVLKELGVETEMDVMSAHRTPEKVLDYSRQAYKRGVGVIIAGAGGASPPCRRSGSGKPTAGNRSTYQIVQLDRRMGFRTFDASDAFRRTGGHRCIGRSQKRRHTGCPDTRHRRQSPARENNTVQGTNEGKSIQGIGKSTPLDFLNPLFKPFTYERLPEISGRRFSRKHKKLRRL